MSVSIVVGLQWGDEGKGRILNMISENATVAIRANGGANAGHTVVKNGEKYALHLLPSSIINPSCKSIIASGVAVDLELLYEEINDLTLKGIDITPNNLKISSKAHIVLKYYKDLDEVYESLRKNPIGTTKRGIGPTYSHKMLRTGMRMEDLVGATEEQLLAKIKETVVADVALYIAKTGKELDFTEYAKEMLKYAKFFEPYICDAISEVHSEIDNPHGNYYNNVVIEGAQAAGLDIDFGTYPDVTSSSCTAAGLAAATGIGPTCVSNVYGVMKAYTSRVGEGPFPTELKDEVGDKIREEGHEYGTTTKRPRRCGWLDLVWLKYATKVNGVTELCINHCDTIGKLDKILVCVAYEYKGKVIQYVPDDLENCKPLYKVFEGNWEGIKSLKHIESVDSSEAEDCVEQIKSFAEQTEEFAEAMEEVEKIERAREYVNYIEKYLGVPALVLGWGPDQEDVELHKIIY